MIKKYKVFRKIQESEDDLLKDLKSLGYENKYTWETIVKAMRSMEDLEDYITITWSGDDLLTRSDSNIKDGVHVYLLNLEYPEDLFNVNADEKRFIEDFLKKLKEYNGSVDGWTLQEIEDAFKDIEVQDTMVSSVDRKKAKVFFSVETDTNMKSDQFGVSVTIKKEKDPPIINIDQSIRAILSDLEYYLEKLDDRTTR